MIGSSDGGGETLTERKWTPGPWVHNKDRGEITSNKGDICIILDENYGNLYFPEGCGIEITGNERNEANAHLIATAPDLYEALDGLLAQVGFDYSPEHPVIKMATDALAKARGEQE
jgi:hypothetical protein